MKYSRTYECGMGDLHNVSDYFGVEDSAKTWELMKSFLDRRRDFDDLDELCSFAEEYGRFRVINRLMDDNGDVILESVEPIESDESNEETEN